jgi:hypothetical protein
VGVASLRRAIRFFDRRQFKQLGLAPLPLDFRAGPKKVSLVRVTFLTSWQRQEPIRHVWRDRAVHWVAGFFWYTMTLHFPD